MSVGGSEEVRALEYGDVGMTSESSDSERTEEGVGRSEIVGVEGDRVLIIVVEVEGRNERCYDVDADIVSEGDAEVELLSSWKAKKANQNKYSLNEDEEEEVGKLVREGAEMDKFLNATGGVAIPKKPRRKSKTSTKEANEVEAGKELVPSTSSGVKEVRLEVELKRKGSEELVFEEKKRKISKSKRKAQEKETKAMKEAVVELKKNVQLLVHNGMKEHKLKAEFLEVDITKITFGEQEEGVEENEGRIIFPPNFDFEFVAVKEEEAEVEEAKVGAGVEGAKVDESQPPL
ncbi:hypothetical protein SLEP1_g22720 [Rubroshorea leprosula]|uniref:Uncharacterized protein n=1 Tax=Rubroshorea leprosula TaxID=152421 RepID=A0AAV5JG67_9ROSI|nr:hypothetical protein SLEP1_g22720 [Rubroshorea leprosula]